MRQQRDEPGVRRVGLARHEVAAPGTAAQAVLAVSTRRGEACPRREQYGRLQVGRGVGSPEEEPCVLDAQRVALGHAPGEEGQVVRDWVSDAEATENGAAAPSLLKHALQLAQLHESG